MAIQIPSDKYKFQRYKEEDKDLIPIVDIDSSLTGSSFIEFNIYDLNDRLLYHTPNYSKYSVTDDSPSSGEGISQFNIDPDLDVKSQGFDSGNYVAYYTFVTNQIGSPFQKLYIEEISSDRTEIRLNSTALDSFEIEDQTDNFIDFREENIYFTDFLLNFGNNQQVIANNIKLDDEDENNPTILIKLYEELPDIFQEKSQLYIITSYSSPEAFSVVYSPTITEFNDSISLEGPNFNLPIKSEVNNSSQNLSADDILLGSTTTLSNQIQGILSQSAINISIDYTDYNDFIHFSSAETRLENFYYKVSLLEQYSGSISSLINTTGSSTSIQLLEDKISSIITNFDGYDKFLYYETGSTSWPKTSQTKPYTLAKTGSAEVITWYGTSNQNSLDFGGQIASASLFDLDNPDYLYSTIPEYLREDSENQPYDLFIDMLAQYYDNVWLYTKDISQKYNTDNRLDFGVSKDLVSDAIKDFGLKLYQNNFSNSDLYTAFLGITPSGSLFPFPEITESMPVPTGFEFVDTLISASNDVISMDDTNKSLYKRIYHNLPYLLNKKGTTAGLRALITSYGIPDTILKISEFGGKDKVNANDYDLYSNHFNYAFKADGFNSMYTEWTVNPEWSSPLNQPNSVQFRFKTQDITSNISPFGLSNLKQTLWRVQNTAATHQNLELVLEYTGSGLDSGSLVNDSGSYDGSIPNPEYKFAKLTFYPDTSDTNTTASVYLPFVDGEWWSVMIQKNESNYDLFAGNKIYNGDTGTKIGFYASSSVVTGSDQAWTTQASSGATQFYGTAQFGISTYGGNGGGGGGPAPASQTPTLWGALEWGNDNWGYNEAPSGFGTSYFGSGGPIGNSLSGSLQEVRYFNIAISESVFKDYIMNPLSFESNGVNTAPNNLIFRGALGSELDLLTSSSIHPLTTGSWVARNSFQDTNTASFSSTPIYEPNTEYLFQDQPAVGIKNRITDKVRWENNVLPGNTLSQYRKIAQTTEASASYSENINYLEVAFSPQNQINDDIIGQMGHFNIGDYIGDPRDRSSRSVIYPSLNSLSEDYFKKYIKQYDLTDFVRLIKFFDNSLFKMIKDFIPARTSLASGLVIKQHLLERNKYPQPQMSYSDESELSGSIDMVKIEGGAAGMFNEFNSTTTSPSGSLQQGPNNPFNITQSWDITTPSLYGKVTKTHDSQTEFYDGELSGSVMLITDGELNEENPFKLQSPIPANYKVRVYSSTVVSEDVFLQLENNPTPGYISLFLDLSGGGYVKLIKVAQKDQDGNDFSVSLGSLNSISIPWSIGTINYPILSSVDKTTYNTLTTSNTLGTIYQPDTTQVDYSTSGSMDGLTIGRNEKLGTVKNFNLPISNVISDPTSFIVNNTYTVNTIPQKDITVNFSGTIQVTNFNITTGVYLRLFRVPFGESLINLQNPLVNVNIPADPINFNYPPVNYNISHTFSYTSFQSELEPGDQVVLALTAGTPPVNDIYNTNATLSNSQMEVTSTPSTGPTLPTVINPYLPSLFQNSEYDVIINNVDEYIENPFLQDLDYSTNALVPINIDRVISGSAEKGTVPELYYTSLKQILPRYLGSKNQTTGFNLYNPDVPSSTYFPQVGIKAPYIDVTNLIQTSSTIYLPSGPYDPFPPSCMFPGLESTITSNSEIFEFVEGTAVDNLGNDQPINLIKINKTPLKNFYEKNPSLSVSYKIKGTVKDIQTSYQGLGIGFCVVKLINGKVEKAQTYNTQGSDTYKHITRNNIFWTNTNDTDFNFEESISLENLVNNSEQDRIYISLALSAFNYDGNTPPAIGDFYITDLEPAIQINYSNKQNIGTYGQTPSVDILDTNIYEFEWGDSGYPELIDGGNLKTGNILQVSSPELVQLADPNTDVKTIEILEPIGGLRQGSAAIYNRVIAQDGTPSNLINTPAINQFYTAFTSSIQIRGEAYADSKEFWISSLETNQYKKTLDTGLYAGNQVKLTMYPNENAGANPKTPKTTTILSTEWGMPKESTYAITSSVYVSNTINSVTTTAAGFIQDQTPYIYLFRRDLLNKIKKNEDGFYEPTQTFKPTYNSFNNQINSDINEGGRWFITFYNQFEYPDNDGNYDAPLTTGSLSPYNFGFTDQKENEDYIYPLANKGIYEILGTRDRFSGFVQLLTNHNWNESRLIGGNGVTTNIPSHPDLSNPSSISGEKGSLGMLMWKAESYNKSEYIVIGNKVGGLVNAGAILPKNTAKYVDDNFEVITKQYGANKT